MDPLKGLTMAVVKDLLMVASWGDGKAERLVVVSEFETVVERVVVWVLLMVG
jgi:hypothetical protein